MVEKRHGQVVLYEILSRTSDIKGVPILEGFPHLVKFIQCYFPTSILFSKEHEVPEVRRDVIWLNTEQSGLRAIQVSLEVVRNCVVGHVNCTI